MVSSEPVRSRPVVRFRTNHGVVFNEGRLTLVARGPARHILVGMSDREIEVPPDGGVLDHLVATAQHGGPVYLTRDGVRVAAVVGADLAESLTRDQADDDDPAAADRVAQLVDELDQANGPVGQDELDEVDRLWRANLGR